MKNILNIAHRGFHLYYPDNTLESFKAALDLGVDGIEMDIQETADGEFVVFHDRKLNGTSITNLSLHEINGILLQNEYRIPTLEQALDICGYRTKLFIELKVVRSLNSLLKLLREKVSIRQDMLLSFNDSLLADVFSQCSDISIALITACSTDNLVEKAIAVHCKAIVVLYTLINQDLMEKANDSGLCVYVWGCPDIEAINRLMRFKIKGFINDFPHIVKAHTK